MVKTKIQWLIIILIGLSILGQAWANDANQIELATLGIQANWPIGVRTMRGGAHVFPRKRDKYSHVPDFLKGLHFTVNSQRRIITISCRVISSGRMYVSVFGDNELKCCRAKHEWKKYGVMHGSEFKGNNEWSIYGTEVNAGEILILLEDDPMGLAVAAKQITKDASRPVPPVATVKNAERFTDDKTVQRRPIEYLVFGDGNDVTFILAAIHGDEQAGITVVNQLAKYLDDNPSVLTNRRVVLLANANPDGVARFNHYNTRGVDLNRNFPSKNRINVGRSGRKGLSEPETKVIHNIIEKYSPTRIVSIHQMRGWSPYSTKSPGMVDWEGPVEALAKRMSTLCRTYFIFKSYNGRVLSNIYLISYT